MATWNMGQYDDIKNDAQWIYTRQRQDVLDKRAAQDYALKRESDKRKAAREKAEFDQYMRTLPARQQLADMKLRNETNDLQTKLTEYDFKNRGYSGKRNAILRHLAQGDENTIEAARDLIKENNINLAFVPLYKKEMEAEEKAEQAKKIANLQIQQAEDNYKLNNRVNKGKIAALDYANLQREFSSRTYSPFQEAVLKLKASGGNVNALTDAEKNAINTYMLETYQYTPDENDWNDLANSSDEQLKEKGINPAYVPLYAEQQRAAAAENAKYARQNAAEIAQAQQEQAYKSVSAEIASYYNAAVNRGEIDPQKTKSKDTIDHASQIYINALKSGKQITYKQAVEQAAGIKPETRPRSDLEWIKQLDTLYGGKFRNLKNEKQKEVIDKAKEFEKEVLEMLQTRGIQSWGELPLDELRLLDRVWQNSINDDDLYSPFQNQIFLRERDDLYAQKVPLIKELRQLEAENTMDYYDVNSNIRVSYNPELAKKVDRLKTRIDNINDAIKMREKKLSARGIKFKEYK